MVEGNERSALPLRLHTMLLALAGRLDDSALSEARRLAARARSDEAAELITGALVAGRIPVRAAEQRELAALLAASAADDWFAEQLLVDDAHTDVQHRFSGGAGVADGVAEALAPVLRRLPDVRSVHAVWRNTVAGSVPGPMPQRLVLAEVGPEGSALATAYRMDVALHLAGISAAVEVTDVGSPRSEYHAQALAAAEPVDMGDAPNATLGASASAPTPPLAPQHNREPERQAREPEPERQPVREPEPVREREPDDAGVAPNATLGASNAPNATLGASASAPTPPLAPQHEREPEPEQQAVAEPQPEPEPEPARQEVVETPEPEPQPEPVQQAVEQEPEEPEPARQEVVETPEPEPEEQQSAQEPASAAFAKPPWQVQVAPARQQPSDAELAPGELFWPQSEPPAPKTTQQQPAQQSAETRAETTTELKGSELRQLRSAIATGSKPSDPTKITGAADPTQITEPAEPAAEPEPTKITGASEPTRVTESADAARSSHEFPTSDLDNPRLSDRDRELLRELHAELAKREREQAAQVRLNGWEPGGAR